MASRFRTPSSSSTRSRWTSTMTHNRDQPQRQRHRQPITETKAFLKIDKYTGGQSSFRQWKHQ
eukprot:4768714-Heterocapsa_arctica.AAC.1